MAILVGRRQVRRPATKIPTPSHATEGKQVTNDTTALAVIDPIRKALSTAVTVEDFKGARDMAEAARSWARSRGMSIEVENSAAEWVLRAERGIGKALISLSEQGLRADAGAGPGRGRNARGTATPVTLHELIGARNEPTSRALASEWQRLARNFSDEQFETLLADAKAHTDLRIAKVNFYRPERARSNGEGPTPENADFLAFRTGAQRLLGWQVDDEGVGTYTKNDLMLLPNDELRTVAELVKALAGAYTEAVNARR